MQHNLCFFNKCHVYQKEITWNIRNLHVQEHAYQTYVADECTYEVCFSYFCAGVPIINKFFYPILKLISEKKIEI